MIIRVYGIVQGVGFRPFVSRIADRNKILGSVCNKGSYVEIAAHGKDENIKDFLTALEEEAPERSAILKVDISDGEQDTNSYEEFAIIESERETGDIFVSPDIATCPKCKEELFDKNNRRYLHPFINCTACGPRLTILDSMPYDRERTSMGEFPMCEECSYEYTHAQTRRYDAQPVCCNDCGPRVYIIGRNCFDREAISYTRKIISEGKIAAIKGIGGFHLCCDATNEEAVSRLRSLKTRPAKPFAVMMKNLETVERECNVSENIKEILDGHQKPIILLKKKKAGKLCNSVAPDNPNVGVMLPYAPVQLLLFDYDDGIVMPDCLVMTSGNPKGAPICKDDEGAVLELSKLCDVILSHDRKIRLRADDTVMDFYRGEPYMIRRSRGYAPLPVMMSKRIEKHVLSVGGELKNTFCIGKNNLFYQSPYIGDMTDLRTVKALEESIVRMETLFEAKPEIVACDMHPKYNTTFVAQNLLLEVMKVQHHYAHIVSCMAENDLPLDEKVIGVSFDGTGYGLDGTIWGGEFLVCGYDGFKRAGHIKPFKHAGGDIASRQGYRIAIAILYGMLNDVDKVKDYVNKFEFCDEKTLGAQFMMADNNINCVKSTSAGRLFDAASAVLGIRTFSTFEGEASMSLQFAAQKYEDTIFSEEELISKCDVMTKDDFKRIENELDMSDIIENELLDLISDEKYFENEEENFVLPTDRLLKLMADARAAGIDTNKCAYFFHYALAKFITYGCEIISKQSHDFKKIKTAALSGGVFQNKLLLKMCDAMLNERGYRVCRHSLIPPNDGGIALGQAVAAMYNEK